MGTVWSLPVLLLLGCFPCYSQGVHSLECLNDFISNVTCIWNSTAVDPETACILLGFRHEHKIECNLMHLDNRERYRRSCHLIFPENFGHFSKLEIKVKCENFTTPVANITDYLPKQYIKMHPPGLPRCIGSTVTWDPGFPLSKFIFSYSFQLQYKRSDQNWKDVPLIDVKNKQTSLQLPEELLVQGVVYQTRVRVKFDKNELDGEWSDWSPIASWRAKELPSGSTGVLDLHVNTKLLISIPAVLLCLLLFFALKTHNFSWAFRVKPIPDPSKFFHVLNSVHNGNFQKWLHPIFAPESFSAFRCADDISPVEVTNVKHHSKERCMETTYKLSVMTDYDNRDRSSSFFDMSDFCSQDHSSSQTEGYSTFFGYHPTGGSTEGNSAAEETDDNSPLQSSSPYKLLEQLPQFALKASHPGMRHEHEETREDDLPK